MERRKCTPQRCHPERNACFLPAFKRAGFRRRWLCELLPP
jgi:hypothetical protein